MADAGVLSDPERIATTSSESGPTRRRSLMRAAGHPGLVGLALIASLAVQGWALFPEFRLWAFEGRAANETPRETWDRVHAIPPNGTRYSNRFSRPTDDPAAFGRAAREALDPVVGFVTDPSRRGTFAPSDLPAWPFDGAAEASNGGVYRPPLEIRRTVKPGRFSDRIVHRGDSPEAKGISGLPTSNLDTVASGWPWRSRMIDQPDAIFGEITFWTGPRTTRWSWLPLAASLVVVAAGFLGALRVPGLIRHLWRWRHGRCPGCGYPAPAGIACPECGRRPPRGRDQPITSDSSEPSPSGSRV